MRARLFLNIALLLAIAGLILLLWWNPGDAPSTPPITRLQPDSITQVRIDYPDAPSLQLSRDGDQWRITAPVQARAQASEVAPILQLATQVPTRSYPVSEIKLSEIGLEPPRQTVTLNGQKIQRTIQLGGSDALENNRYARIGEQVFMIPAPLDTALDADYAELVAREILPENSRITRLELPQATLTPTDQGGWQITPATQDPGADAAQFTIDAWTRARALWIKPADPAKKPDGEVRLQTQSGETVTLEVVAREPQLILRAPGLGVDYHLAANQAAPLLDLEHPQTKADAKLKSRPDVELLPNADESEK